MKFDLKTKIISGVVLGLVAIGILCIIASNLTKADRVVTKFKDSIATDNKSELESILSTDDSKLKINDDNVEAIIKYYKNNPKKLNDLVSKLNKEASRVLRVKAHNQVSFTGFNLEYVGKKYLFFPDYKVCVKPSYLEVQAFSKDIKLKLDNKAIGETDSDKFTKKYGPFMPVSHTLVADYKGKYVSVSRSYKANLDDGFNPVPVSVLNDLNFIKVDSDQQEAEIYVNDKDTGVKVKDAVNGFGPICKDTKIYAVVDNNGSKLKSEIHNLSDYDDDVYLSFNPLSGIGKYDVDKHDVKEVIDGYISAFTNAIDSNDMSNLKQYVSSGSDLDNQLSKYISDTYQKGIEENSTDYRIVSVDFAADKKSGTVTTDEIYDIVDENKQTSSKIFSYKYTFKYNDSTKSFQLTSRTESK